MTVTNFDKFHVIAVVSNPVNYESRFQNYSIFEESIIRKGAKLWTVELITGARPPRITSVDCDRHIQVWQSAIDGELWHKEQLINIAIQYIAEHAPDFRYIMWTDADMLFERDILDKTVNALQTWPVVQAWSHLINVDADGGTTGVLKSFMFCRENGLNIQKKGYPARWGSPGGAWAFRREVLNQFGCALSGPILDFAIAGSGDNYFARAAVGEIEHCIDARFTESYKKWIRTYADNLDRALKRNVGYVSTTARHLFHGSYSQRGYEWRNNILIDCKFDPETDLTRDVSGLFRLIINTPRQMQLRDSLRRYFRSRKEDTVIMPQPAATT